MRSLASLVAALAVVAGLAAGGYWLYQQASQPHSGSSGGFEAVTATEGGTSLTLANDTRFVLTVTLRQGTEQVRFEVAPGQHETKALAGGTYNVEGRISDPKTAPFTAHWTFQPGGNYNADFSVDGKTQQVAVAVALLATGQGASQGKSPAPAGTTKGRTHP